MLDRISQLEQNMEVVMNKNNSLQMEINTMKTTIKLMMVDRKRDQYVALVRDLASSFKIKKQQDTFVKNGMEIAADSLQPLFDELENNPSSSLAEFSSIIESFYFNNYYNFLEKLKALIAQIND